VWRLRVYAGRRANGTPIQIQKTVEVKDPRPGAGKRLAERELATMVAKVASGNISTGSETVEELLKRWLDHIGPNRSPTTIRKYRDLADRDRHSRVGQGQAEGPHRPASSIGSTGS